ncbi:ATP-binding protein [Pseudonocardia sichuanensis]|uniref:Anti-sigma regulatory factor (Ser/Thr protein kinase) n=1 Tax=Pseudonocardia kunmingensis TaxID=630975 RepID=A0A543E3K1_9PSEU|nr:ATP-binding protein [Pseudonocardia kunmingensis]TQM16166.1 anti-sigma regulatory factor (Ser/Thr protein kinase) [Pseudonocardia kunmingensis]
MSTQSMTLDVPPAPDAPRSVRRLVRSILDVWQCSSPDGAADAELLTHEIVANAVEHAGGEHSLALELAHSDGWLRVSLADGSAVRPMIREINDPAVGGLGMRMVDTIADRWGSEDHHGGKRVWFELRLRPT